MGSRGPFVNNSGNLYCKKTYILALLFNNFLLRYYMAICANILPLPFFLGLLRVKKRGQEKEGPKSALKSFKFV